MTITHIITHVYLYCVVFGVCKIGSLTAGLASPPLVVLPSGSKEFV